MALVTLVVRVAMVVRRGEGHSDIVASFFHFDHDASGAFSWREFKYMVYHDLRLAISLSAASGRARVPRRGCTTAPFAACA